MSGATPPGAGPIELRLNSIAQLFHTLDPSPFREGDLDAVAESYILDWARELPEKQPLRILVNLPPEELARPQAAQIGEAIRHFFAARARTERNDLRELFQSGRKAMVIGFGILGLCLLGALQINALLSGGPLSRIAQESLVIIGWVAIWRPAEIFLYGWIPLTRRAQLFRRLSEAMVEVRASAASG